MSTKSRDVVVLLLTDVCLRWLIDKENGKKQTVGEMVDRFLALLDQQGFEIVKKSQPHEN